MNGYTSRTLWGLIILLPCLAALPTGSVHANPRDAGDQYTMNINITGNVVVNGSCTFNQSGTVGVGFGDVKYSTLNGKNTLVGTYIQPLASSMTCSGNTEGKTQMKFDSTIGSTVNYQGLSLLPVMNADSSQSRSLGIRLQVNDIPQDTGKWFDVDMTKPPVLKAELIQTGDGSDFVSGSTFTANATLTMAFN